MGKEGSNSDTIFSKGEYIYAIGWNNTTKNLY